MNQLYRALHMPTARLAKKLAGWEEVYTIGYRPYQPGASLPETGSGQFAALPADPRFWYADPLLFEQEGESWLFCEAFDRRAHKGLLAVSRFAQGQLQAPQPVLEEPFHLSFPNVFCWRGQIWMLPESGADGSLRLYRCQQFPHKWTLARRFAVEGELCDPILVRESETALTILCSETLPSDQLQVKYRLFTLSGPTEDLTLTPDTDYNAAQSWNYCDRNAGPLFCTGSTQWRPAQLSTDIDYGVALQFWKQTPDGETPGPVVGCGEVRLEGIAPGDMVGVHTYCHDSRWEIVDLRYLRFHPAKYLHR